MKHIDNLTKSEMNILVAKACGYKVRRYVPQAWDDPNEEYDIIEVLFEDTDAWLEYDPLNWWNDCGPLLDKFKISVECVTSIPCWSAFNPIKNPFFVFGETPQEAIVRAVIACKFGEEIDEICFDSLDTQSESY